MLEVGKFIKTKGARDGIGLRKIVEVRAHDLLVDHYRWTGIVCTTNDTTRAVFKTPRGKIYWRRVKREPYSSVVMINKVIRVYDVDEDGYLVTEHKYKAE